MVLSNTWKQHFLTLATNEDANKNVAAFAGDTTFAGKTDFPAEILRAFHEDPDSDIIANSLIPNKVAFYHSIINLGGSRARPTNKIIGLFGSGPEAIAMKFEENSISTEINLPCPSVATLKNISDKANVLTAVAPANRPRAFHNASFQFLPPFVSGPFLEFQDRDPAQLLVELNSIISAHDTAHANDDTFPNATEHCKDLRSFLWCCANNSIEPLKCSPDPDDVALSDYHTSRRDQCLTPLIQIPDADAEPLRNTEAVQQLASNVQNQPDLIEELKKGREDAKKNSKQKFDDLHDSSQRLILNASSQNGEVTPGSPSVTCSNFYKKSSAAKAGNYLTATLKDTYACNPDLQPGFTQALYDGHFTRDREDSPSNFSFFLCPRMQPLSSGDRKRSTILQIKNKQGKGWSDQDYADAVKQGISTPDDINVSNHQYRIWWGCSSFFFGNNSLLPQRLAQLIQDIALHCITFESQQINDSKFFTKLGYAVDTRVYRWLQQCEMHTDREKVDDTLINFTPIITAVLNDQFIQRLPKTFKSIEEDEDQHTHSLGLISNKKQKRDNNQDESRLDKNTGQIPDWIASKEVYASKFAGKHLETRPTFQGRPMCQRYHSKGHCFTDCINKVTHVPSNTVPPPIKSRYATYCTLCTNATA